jgi:hypothetical protein
VTKQQTLTLLGRSLFKALALFGAFKLATGCAALQSGGKADPVKVAQAAIEIAQCVDNSLRTRALELVPTPPAPRPLDPSPYEAGK